MLAAGALLGLNLNSQNYVHFTFDCDKRELETADFDDRIEMAALVHRDVASQFGWPWMLAMGETRASVTVKNTQVSELRKLPIHRGGCLIFTLSPEEFARMTPDLFQKYQQQPIQDISRYHVQYDYAAMDFAIAVAILLALVVSLEWFLRRKIKLGPQPKLQPEV